jgi:signal transduction histidine kinase
VPESAPSAELERLVRQRDSLREVIESIGAELDLRSLLTRIVRLACELLDAEDGAIGLYDEARGVIRTEAIFKMPEEELHAEMPSGVGLAGQVLLTRAPVVLEHYGMLPHPMHTELPENAVVGVPLFWGDRLVGVFGLGARPPRRFGPADVETLALFGHHSAIAIENARRHESEVRRGERLQALARIGSIITAGLEPRELLQRTADAIHEVLGYPNVAIPLLDPEDPGMVVIGVLGGHYRDHVEPGVRQPVTRGIIGAAVRERRPQLVNDVTADPRYISPPGAVGIRAELAVPIMLGEETLGVLNVESASPFDEEDQTALGVVADHLAVALRNARLFGQAQQLAALEERQRLARDLHDSVVQLLFSATLVAQSVGRAFRRDATEGESQVQRLLELNRAALLEMRSLVTGLRPTEPVPRELASAESALLGLQRLRREGVAAALRAYAEEIRPDGLLVELEAGAYAPQPLDREEALYRIGQEALNNVAKHARARRVRVVLQSGGDGVRLDVGDDGVGFDPGVLARSWSGSGGGLGLVSMRERAEALGGRVRIGSSPEGGTVVEVQVPRERAR